MDFRTLTVDQLPSHFETTLADVRTTFAPLDIRQLNWRTDDNSWSVAQCLEHLINANREMCGAITKAADASHPRTAWQRVPLMPKVFGRALVTSLTPTSARKFNAPQRSHPSASEIDSRVIDRFAAAQRDVSTLLRSLAGRDLGRLIMVSPFIRFVTYSVLDGFRIIAVHERRHFEQARRVVAAPGFPTREIR